MSSSKSGKKKSVQKLILKRWRSPGQATHEFCPSSASLDFLKENELGYGTLKQRRPLRNEYWKTNFWKAIDWSHKHLHQLGLKRLVDSSCLKSNANFNDKDAKGDKYYRPTNQAQRYPRDRADIVSTRGARISIALHIGSQKKRKVSEVEAFSTQKAIFCSFQALVLTFPLSLSLVIEAQAC